MKISFVIPVYNVERYLDECLQSILGQTEEDIEVVIVNDGSTDGSYDIARGYAVQDQRIVLISQKNKGLSEARNIGLKNATGDYVIYVDSDDYVSKNIVQTLNRTVEKYGDLDMILFSRCCFSVKWYKNEVIQSGVNEVKDGISFFKETLSSGPFNAYVCQRCFSRKFLQKHYLFFISGILHEDFSYSVVSMLLASHVLAIPDVLVYYRRDNALSITHNISPKDIDVLITLEYIDTFLQDKAYRDLRETEEFQTAMFKWVANAIFFKYPKHNFFNRVGWENCKRIRAHALFRKYLNRSKRASSISFGKQMAACLIDANIALFYCFRKLHFMATCFKR